MKTKCTKENRCETHKNGKYLKWKCGGGYSPEERHKKFIENKIKCEKCGNPATQKICQKCYYKFHTHYLKGKKLPKWWVKRIKETQPKGEKHLSWLGENAKYSSKHKWIVRWFGNPKKCSECGVVGKPNKGGKWNIQWANISGKYTRNENDYRGLCTKCHNRFDGIYQETENIPHGKIKRYRRGCRCELCKTAKHLYRNKLLKYNEIAK
jgi:hypothetical protein